MCGIFCAICGSSDEAQSKRTKIEENIQSFLTRRGPDHFGEKQLNCLLSNDEKLDRHFVHLKAAVLHLRGKCAAKQPAEDSFGNVLAWNGEIFAGLEVPAHESDTRALLRSLHTTEHNSTEHILRTISSIHGPWAFVYYQASQDTLWFGRDYFGRRSLLWHFPSSSSADLFALSSTGTRLVEEAGEQFWKEVPASGIYSVELKKLGEYLPKGDDYVGDFQDILRLHPWKHSSVSNLICPVRNLFNREIPKYLTTSCTNHPEESCYGMNTTYSVLKSNIDGNEHSRTDKHSSTVSSRISSSSVEVDSTQSQVKARVGEMNSESESGDTSCGSQFDVNFSHVDDKNNTNISTKVNSHSDHEGREVHQMTVELNRSTPTNVNETSDDGQMQQTFHSITENEQNSLRSTHNHRATSNSSKLLRNENQRDRPSPQPSGILLENRGVDVGVIPCTRENVVEQFTSVLLEAVKRRVFNIPRKKPCIPGRTTDGGDNACEKKENVCDASETKSNVGILFSGGLDSIVLAALADRCVPPGESIDLINLAFGQKKANKSKNSKRDRKNQENHSECNGFKFEVPDRITGRSGVAELKHINPDRAWNFIEVNVTLEELQKERSMYITHLVYPQSTVLDDSIGCALWFAARGQGYLTCNDCLNSITDQHSSCEHHPLYTSPAKVLLVGMGADEQLGGYARHRSRFNQEGWKGLVDEIEMEVHRISERNLGRDDRCISDHGRESRYPFLDEDVVSFLNELPVSIKCDPRLPRGIGEKILLRKVAKSIGLTGSSDLPKRAIQFGSRITKLESSREKGSEKCHRF